MRGVYYSALYAHTIQVSDDSSSVSIDSVPSLPSPFPTWEQLVLTSKVVYENNG